MSRSFVNSECPYSELYSCPPCSRRLPPLFTHVHGRNLMWQSEFIGFMKGDGGGGWEEPASTFVELFDRYYYGLLDLRRDSMRMVFEVLVQQKEIGGGGDYVLAETGTTFGSTGWMESGQSALLFDRFLNFPGVDGVLYSVDLDKESCSISRELCSDKVVVVNGDSVEYFELLDKELKEGGKKVDLIYLDSFDVSDDNWVGGEGGEEEPAGHALRELEVRSTPRQAHARAHKHAHTHHPAQNARQAVAVENALIDRLATRHSRARCAEDRLRTRCKRVS